MLNIRTTISLLHIFLFGIVFFCACEKVESSGHKNNKSKVITVPFYIVLKDKLTPYGVMGLYLARELDKFKDINVKIIKTEGSLSGLLSIDESKNGIAIVQSDVLYHYINGNHSNFPAPKKRSYVRAISRLFPEFVHFKAYGPRLESILDYKSVCGGKEGSGTLVTSTNIRDVLDASWETLHDCFDETKQTPDNSKSRLVVETFSPSTARNSTPITNKKYEPQYLHESMAKVMANAFIGTYQSINKDNERFNKSISKPTSQVKSKAKSLVKSEPATISLDAILVVYQEIDDTVILRIKEILSKLDKDLADIKQVDCKLDGKTDYCKRIEIPHNTFHKNNDTTKKNLLNLSNSVKPEHILFQTAYTDYLHILFPISCWSVNKININCLDDTKELSELRNMIASDKKYGAMENNGFENLPIALHKSLRVQKLDFFSRLVINSFPQEIFKYFLVVPIILYILIYIRSLWERCSANDVLLNIYDDLKRNTKLIGFIGGVVILHLVIAILIWLSEYHSTSVGKDADLAYAGIGETLKWLLSHVTNAPQGKQIQSPYSMLWLGLLQTGYAAGGIILVMGLSNRLLTWFRRNKMTKFVFIIGKGDSWHSVKKELSGMNNDFVVTNYQIDEILQSKNYEKSKFEASSDDIIPLNLKGIEKQASAFIVLSDRIAAKEIGVDECDLWVARTVMSIRKWCNNINKNCHITAEVRSPEHHDLIMKAGASQAICVERFGGELIAQSIKNPGIVNIFDRLIHTTADTNEFYFDSIDEEYIGHTFKEIVFKYYCNAHKHSQESFRLPIGIERGEEIILNPKDPDMKIKTNDKLIVLARES